MSRNEISKKISEMAEVVSADWMLLLRATEQRGAGRGGVAS